MLRSLITRGSSLEIMDFTSPWDMGDVTFVVEGQRVYASRTILSMWSPVMKAMFNDDFLEKVAKEIELPGKIYADIVELIMVLHPPNKDLDESNVSIILPLAREYQMEDLTKRCERFLLERPPSVQGLLLAEEFNLNSLHSRCMDYIGRTRLYELTQEEEFEILQSDTKVQILLEKSIKYEHVLYEIRNILEGRKPEQKRFRAGCALCTFSCTETAQERKQMPHNAGSDRECRNCALYMARKIAGKINDLP